MPATIAELVDALPVDDPDVETTQRELEAVLARIPDGEMPLGRMRRGWALGSLPAKIAAAYFAWWLRRAFTDGEETRELDETHLKAALRLLGTMGYLRGAAMKVGQMLAHYPDVVPDEFADVLGRLHFEAPPMHFELLRDLVRRELGRDPEQLFDAFETRAFAAASLGQVHRARLKGSGTPLAIKIQYPGIASTISSDFRNLRAIAGAMRFGRDRENLLAQVDELRRMLETEIDYEQEAMFLRRARELFTEAEGIVVPRVHADLSTRRVLTMDYVDGVHLPQFLAQEPSQERRDAFGTRLLIAQLRLWYRGRVRYADPHPGNFFFMPDGRLGLVDFGCCHAFNDDDWDYLCEVERSYDLSRDAFRRALLRAADLDPSGSHDPEHLDLLERYGDWLREPVDREGAFDFRDASYFRRGMEIYTEIVKRRYIRSLPVNTWIGKQFFGLRAILTRLGARVEYGALLRAETTVPPSP